MHQFLDLGTGIPNENNVHGVAQATKPASRIGTSTTTPSCWPTLMSTEIQAGIDGLVRSADENPNTTYRFFMRSHAEILEYFHGLEMVEPGLVPIDEWRPEVPPPDVYPPGVQKAPSYGGLARKP